MGWSIAGVAVAASLVAGAFAVAGTRLTEPAVPDSCLRTGARPRGRKYRGGRDGGPERPSILDLGHAPPRRQPIRSGADRLFRTSPRVGPRDARNRGRLSGPRRPQPDRESAEDEQEDDDARGEHVHQEHPPAGRISAGEDAVQHREDERRHGRDVQGSPHFRGVVPSEPRRHRAPARCRTCR